MPEALPTPGDKVYVVDDLTFAIKETVVKDAPSECLWVEGVRSRVLVGPARWAKTKAKAQQKALALATNKRAELTDKLAFVNAAIAKLGGKSK